MTNYKGKGEHSVNELEKIIQEQIEIIYELKQELKFHKEQNEAMSSDMDKMQNMTKNIIDKKTKTLRFKFTFYGSFKDISLISIAYNIDCRDSFYFEFVLIGFWLRIHSINF